ncbi:MAG: YebC/PmpR family DNA-binding transcriptional regulator [Chloroflexi bacterium]|nr:YebC/PmpR family DNA-binding transcriptional regulator [Chloroflexota bacterium]
MAGHSKWSQIKRQKGVADAKRGQLFTKIGREIQAAARRSGLNPNDNPSLRLALARAKQANMPKGTIERALARAAGAGGGEDWEEIRYEAYGPGGVALLIDALTDNRNRTAADVRAALTKYNGNLGATGSVAWAFEPCGIVVVDLAEGVDADNVALEAIDAGAADVTIDETLVEVRTALADLEAVRHGMSGAGVAIASAETVMRPLNQIALEEADARTLLRLVEQLEELDDIQSVHSNADLPESVLTEL